MKSTETSSAVCPPSSVLGPRAMSMTLLRVKPTSYSVQWSGSALGEVTFFGRKRVKECSIITKSPFLIAPGTSSCGTRGIMDFGRIPSVALKTLENAFVPSEAKADALKSPYLLSWVAQTVMST